MKTNAQIILREVEKWMGEGKGNFYQDDDCYVWSPKEKWDFLIIIVLQKNENENEMEIVYDNEGIHALGLSMQSWTSDPLILLKDYPIVKNSFESWLVMNELS